MNFREIADIVLGSSQADQTEVLAMEQDESLTRFANNFVHQNVTERNVQITVRSAVGTKVGIAVSNDLAPDSLRSLAGRAHEAAKLYGVSARKRTPARLNVYRPPAPSPYRSPSSKKKPDDTGPG